MGQESTVSARKSKNQQARKGSKADDLHASRRNSALDLTPESPIETSESALVISTRPDTRKTGSVTITANGTCLLRLRVTGEDFEILSPSPERGIALEKGERYVATIAFTARARGSVSGELELTSTAHEGSVLTLDTRRVVKLHGTTDALEGSWTKKRRRTDVKGDNPPGTKIRPRLRIRDSTENGRKSGGQLPREPGRVAAFNYVVLSAMTDGLSGAEPLSGPVKVGDRIRLKLVVNGSEGPLSLSGHPASGLSIVEQSDSNQRVVSITLAAEANGIFNVRFSRGRSQFKGNPLRIVVGDNTAVNVLTKTDARELAANIVNQLDSVLINMSGALDEFDKAASSPSKNEAKQRAALEVAVGELKNLALKLAAQPVRRVPVVGAALYETFKSGLSIGGKLEGEAARSKSATTANQLKDFVNDARGSITDARASIKQGQSRFETGVKQDHIRLDANAQILFRLKLQEIGDTIESQARGPLSRQAQFARLVRGWMQAATKKDSRANRLVIRLTKDWTLESWFLAGPLGDRLGEELIRLQGSLNVAELGLPIEIRYLVASAYLAPDGTLERLVANGLAANPSGLLKRLEEQLASRGIPEVTGPPGERGTVDIVREQVKPTAGQNPQSNQS